MSTEVVKEKMALCIPTRQYLSMLGMPNDKIEQYLNSATPAEELKDFHFNGHPILGLKSFFNSFETSLRSRKKGSETYCEDDINYLQLLPYCTYRNITSNGNRSILTYVRGSSGDESRLHDLLSIGIGGHVEKKPEGEITTFDILVDNLIQESEEEAGIILTKEEAAKFLNKAVLYFLPVGVNRVHLCISIIVDINKDDVNVSKEPGIIDKLQWIDQPSLGQYCNNIEDETKLEPWSQFVVRERLPYQLAGIDFDMLFDILTHMHANEEIVCPEGPGALTAKIWNYNKVL